MIAYTVAKNSTVFSDKYIFKYTSTSSFPEDEFGGCGNCKKGSSYTATYKTFITKSMDGKGNGFESTNFVYEDNGPNRCPLFVCTVAGSPPSTIRIGGYQRCKSYNIFKAIKFSNDGKETNIDSWAQCLELPKCGKYQYLRLNFIIPLIGKSKFLTTKIENVETTLPTTIFGTTMGTDSFKIQNGKITEQSYEKEIIQQTTTNAMSSIMVLDGETETMSTTAWQATYELPVAVEDDTPRPCGPGNPPIPISLKTFTATVGANIRGTAFRNTVIHLNDYNQYWYRTLNKDSKGTFDKLKVFKFGQRGSPQNETEATIQFIEPISSSQFIYPYNCESASFTYETISITSQASIDRS